MLRNGRDAMLAGPLPRWAADILSAVPARGEGLNRWLLRAAIALRRCGRSEGEALDTLRVATVGEPVKRGEIERAVSRAPRFVEASTGQAVRTTSQWPTRDGEAVAKVLSEMNGFTAADLWEASPVRFFTDEPQAERIIDTLFPGNPILSIGYAAERYRTAPRESHRGRLAAVPFIVPSPMSRLTGTAQDGHESGRCLDNTGPRRFLVVEQDSGTQNEQTAVIAHLAERAPLVLVVHSGGKSLHAWFFCAGQSDERLKRFFAHAVQLGADPATWTRCQFVRMPDGLRQRAGLPAVRQSVLYFNPSTIRTT